ncbi:SURF1 family protein [Paracoccus zhejiangensis]|uniref:SURF1 family protein n=1 Tax=Paracoccus zhejiangensis TaxID=1077935 RepID=UPI001E5DC385|nr:SURF1 family protein [Paracoccus zhejiangensis]
MSHDTLRPRWQVGLALILGVALTLCFAALGVWQMQRLAWKLDLIQKVEVRVEADPVGLSDLLALPPGEQDYRHVTATGQFDHGAETLVQAVTELGGGFWVLTPLRTGAGTVLVNRGFVPPERADPATRPEGQVMGEVSVTGLARQSEPGGGFLRVNDPAADRWYSRDVAAIAAAKSLGPVAPLFIDADATPQPGGYPVGGLTVIAFRNTHLIYALTWFALAAMAAAGVVILLRQGRRQDRA